MTEDSSVSINFKELGELLQVISQTDISELTLKNDQFELTVKKGGQALTNTTTIAMPTTTPVSITPTPITPVDPVEPITDLSSPSPLEKKWKEITSPMVGTFYRSPTPDESPFVEVGERISSGQTVCIIEAMKLMNEIEAEFSGEIMEVLVENGQPVEYGQTLMWVNPA